MVVMLKRVGKDPEVINVENELSSLQHLVGGLIEVVEIGNGLLLICNEEGKIDSLPKNIGLSYDCICGDFFICRDDGYDDFTDLKESDYARVAVWINLRRLDL